MDGGGGFTRGLRGCCRAAFLTAAGSLCAFGAAAGLAAPAPEPPAAPAARPPAPKAAAPGFPAGRVVDLTHHFDGATIYWPTESGFSLERGFEGDTGKGYWYSSNRFAAAEHGGTHIDAPSHFYRGRHRVDQIPLEQLMGAAVAVDVSSRCLGDRDHQVLPADLAAWEKKHGRIPDRAIVLLKTGYGRYWPDRTRYMGTAERGEAAVAKLHFPGLHPDGARWLLRERSVKAVGIDTPSIDYGQSATYQTHVALFERNVPALENVAGLEELPPRGFTVIALPMKIRDGSGGPLRIIAIVPERPGR